MLVDASGKRGGTESSRRDAKRKQRGHLWDSQSNTEVVGDLEEISDMKHIPEKDLALVGSGSVFTQLAELSLIDEYQVMVDPVALGMASRSSEASGTGSISSPCQLE
jgi:dihydrofolate reductase